jgi:dimethylargininase
MLAAGARAARSVRGLSAAAAAAAPAAAAATAAAAAAAGGAGGAPAAAGAAGAGAPPRPRLSAEERLALDAEAAARGAADAAARVAKEWAAGGGGPAAARRAALPRPLIWHEALLHYTHAIVRGLAPDFAARAVRRRDADGARPAIDQAAAEAQHGAYVRALAAAVPTVVTLPPAERAPDSVFIEDTAVVLGRKALATAPTLPARAREVPAVRAALAAAGLTVAAPLPPGAQLDGGDVLYTGREFFVGITDRTNRAGAAAVRHAFPGFRVTEVPIRPLWRAAGGTDARDRRADAAAAGAPAPAPRAPPPLHLKSIVTLAGAGTLVVADTAVGRAVAGAMQDASPYRPRFLLVPDAAAANVVFANGVILAPRFDAIPDSAPVLRAFAAAEGLDLVEVDNSELAKADGALTCCSLLINAAGPV